MIFERMIKILEFRPHLIQDILEGRKTVTWRLFDDKNLSAGDRLLLRDWETGKDFAKAEIVSVREKKLGELEEADFKGHEQYESEEDMYQRFREYYGDTVDKNTVVKIITFKVTGRL